MDQPTNDYFENPEEIRNVWLKFLRAFRKDIYPVFAAEGISFNEAVVLYRYNTLQNEISELIERIGGNDKEEWKS